MRRGRFISIEGPEGSGKSTQAALLADRLRHEGRDVLLVREPGGTPIGEAVRGLLQQTSGNLTPEAETFLFLACRAQLARTVILPALAEGRWVVADRFLDSTLAYQGYGRGLDNGLIARMNRLAVGAAMPDLTLLLDLPVAAGFERLRQRYRANGRGHDRIELESRAFHEKVRQGYLALAQGAGRFRVIPSEGAIEETAAALWKEVSHAWAE